MKTVPLADLITDARPGFASGADVPDGVLQIRMHNISRDGVLNFGKQRRVPRDARTDRFVLRENDVLFNATNSPELVGKTALFRKLAEPVVFSNHFIRLRVDERRADAAYVTRWMQWQHGLGVFSAMAQQWVNQAAVRTERLLRLAVLLPPLDEQRRIARVLEAATRLTSIRTVAEEKLAAVTGAAFHAIADRSIERIPLGMVCSIGGQYGASVPSTEYDPTRPRYVRITDISADGRLSEDRVGPGGKMSDWEKLSLEPGDVLFARSGATVGKTYLHRPGVEPCVFAGYLIRYRTLPDVLLPECLFAYTQSLEYSQWVAARQRAVAQPNINARQYGEDLTVPVPPPCMQNRFREIFRAIERQAARLGAHRAHLDALFASLQHRAFTGAL